MNTFQKYIQGRRKGGSIYVAKKLAYDCYLLYPDDKCVKEEYRYWQKVYWLTGLTTRVLRIDERHVVKMKGWLQQSSSVKSIKLNDLIISFDHPTLIPLIYAEYDDIYQSGMYYDKNGGWLQLPLFLTEDSVGEGPYETEDVQIKKGDVVIDCGANMGLFSILAVKRGAQTVYAFDPQERAQKLLKANSIANNCDGKIIVVPYGLSDKKCTLSFTEVDGNMAASRISHETDTSTTTIECTTIDDWVAENNIPHIDFIKADIEGSERDMLNGARKTIKRDHPCLAICTYHLPDDPEVLRDIILSIDPTYHIDQRKMKLYAW